MNQQTPKNYRPLVLKPKTRTNVVSKNFPKLIDCVFPEERRFEGNAALNPGDVAYYVGERTAVGDYDGALLTPGGPASRPGLPPDRLEEEMHRLFWEGEKRIIFVQGVYGVGKSTFVEYYLRYYCPRVAAKTKEFEEKLVVNVNFRDLKDQNITGKPIAETIFEFIRSALRRSCAGRGFDIERHEGRAFYDYALNRADAKFDELRRKGLDDEAFRDEMIRREGNVPPETWFEAACEFFWDCRTKGNFPFSYFVLVLDNLDQAPDEGVELVAIRIRRWLERYPKLFWRIIVPVRPKTLDRLTLSIQPLQEFGEVTVEAPDLDSVILLRQTLWKDGLDQVEYDNIPREVKDIATEYVEGIRRWLTVNSRSLISHVASGSTRLALNMWRNAICSPMLYELFKDGRTRSGPYYLLYGVLAGGYDSYQVTLAHPIINLFEWEYEGGSPHETLLGMHFLYILNAPTDTRGRIEDSLKRLGYSLNAIERCIRRFEAAHVLYERTDRVIEAVPVTLGGYKQMLRHAAYLDCMALVTAVDDARRGTLSRPANLLGEGFPIRSQNGISFLQHLRMLEENFALGSHISNSQQHSFANELKDLRLPFQWKSCAKAYKWDLEQLATNSAFGLTSAFWADLLAKEPLKHVIAKEFLIGDETGDLMSDYPRSERI